MRKIENEAGFTYLAVLFIVAILGIVTAGIGIIWSAQLQREKERELLFIGGEFRKAIGSYYEKSPGTVKRYPNSLEDLLKDNRMLVVTRHLRRIYIDPMTLKQEWAIVRAPDGGIMGVYSFSSARPIKRRNFAYADLVFENADTYAKWRFIYEPLNAKPAK